MPTPEAALTAGAPEDDVFGGPSDTPSRYRPSRRTLAFAGLGIGVYLATLIATLPAALVVPLAGAGGTIWSGAAPIGASTVNWRWSPLRSLTGLGFAVDFGLSGGVNTLVGTALLRPGRVMFSDVRGTADGALLAPLLQTPFACNLPMTADLRRIVIGGGTRMAEGRIDTQPGSCQGPSGAAPVAVPPLRFDAIDDGDLTRLTLAPTGQPQPAYLLGTLNPDGRISLSVTAEGAAALPFLSPPGGMTIESDL